MYRAYPTQAPRYPNSDDADSFVNIPSRPQSPVPIVQRESSFTDMNGLGRLQEAFADHGTYTEATPTVTVDPTTPLRGSPRMPPRAMHAAGPVQIGTMHEARREPVIIEDSNGSVEGIRPDVDVMRPSSSKHKRHHAQQPRERPPQEQHKSKNMEVVSASVPSFPSRGRLTIASVRRSLQARRIGTIIQGCTRTRQSSSWFNVVATGRKIHITLYLEDSRWSSKTTTATRSLGMTSDVLSLWMVTDRHLSSVGDFSGYYVPQPLHPVIVEDEYGHEICR